MSNDREQRFFLAMRSVGFASDRAAAIACNDGLPPIFEAVAKLCADLARIHPVPLDQNSKPCDIGAALHREREVKNAMAALLQAISDNNDNAPSRVVDLTTFPALKIQEAIR